MKAPGIVFLFLLCVAAAATNVPASSQPDPTDAKIRLLAAALRARDDGDLAAARHHLEILQTVVPNDESVQRLLAGLERRMSQSKGGARLPDAVPLRLDAESEDWIRREEARQRALQDDPGRGDVPADGASRSDPRGSPRGAVAPPGPENEAIPPPAIIPRVMAPPADAAADPFVRVPGDSAGARQRAGASMLRAVDEAWRPAPPRQESAAGPAAPESVSPLWAKLEAITVPNVSFSNLKLAGALNALSAISTEFDSSGTSPAGVNLILVDPGNANPAVTLHVRHLPLRRVLDFITESVGYRYEVQGDAVVVRPVGGIGDLATEFFPVARATVLRMTGQGTVDSGATRSAGDLLAGRAGGAAEHNPAVVEGQSIRAFLQLAGVDFAATPGSSLAFDGSQLIVTHTARNLDRVRNIVGRYREVRQVEIEAKFMEVQEGALEELGVQWNVATKATQRNAGAQAGYQTGGGVTRSLQEAFSFSNSSRTLAITAPGSTTLVNNADGSQSAVAVPGINLALPTAPPTIPGGVPLGAPNATLAHITGIVGEFDVTALVRALSQKSGTELLSAPRLTVLSGNPATITVAQELRYPQSYGQIQSQVGTGSVTGGSSAGVSITSGTPQEFTTRNVGVELRVTPTVEEDNHSISLDLNPKVTEFEGFVEYGGPSVAISGGTTVTVPPGFYQPIFAVREVSTRVTIWDGATLVMGGLTREDVKKVKDKVPVLGSIPLLGRLFRTQGESTQKRNLLIFVTARLVTPGGGLSGARRVDPSGRETASAGRPIN